MAYNLESLVKIPEQILQPDHFHGWILDPSKKPEIESLLIKALFLKQFFETFSPVTSDETDSLASRIRDAAHEAEDILESHLVDQIHSAREGESSMFSPQGLQRLIEEFDSVEEDIKKIMDGSQLLNASSPAVSTMVDRNPKNILVGIDEDSTRLMDRLTGQEPKLEIIPIVGMGGIGKTTLARNVYDDPLPVSHFDTRAWITISQHKHEDENNLKRILLGLLGCVIGELRNEIAQDKNDQLALRLHKSLSGRRYLIVLDDMWVTSDWDDISWFFPDDKNGSRIMVTTRETDVANYVASNSSHHQMQLLNEDESWNLLRQIIFAQETCPRALEEIGKTIAMSCRGLPLAVHVIGGVLSQGERTQKSWTRKSRRM